MADTPDILTKILQRKREEVAQRSAGLPLGELIQRAQTAAPVVHYQVQNGELQTIFTDPRAHADPEPALAEVVVQGVLAPIVGELEHPLVHRGQGNEHRLPRCLPADLETHLLGGFRKTALRGL